MGAIIAAAWFVLLFLAALMRGRRPWIESGASMVRRLWVTGLLTGIASAPVVIAVVTGTRGLGLGERAYVLDEVREEDGSLSYVARPIELPIDRETWQPTLFAVFVTALLGAAILLGNLRPVASFLDETGGAPLEPGHPLQQRVQDLAGSVGVRPPRVVVSHSSPSGLMRMNAAAGGLFGPVLVATDGLLHRMSDRDRDAIVAHELGHFLRGGIWPRFLLALGYPVLAVLASTRLDSVTSIALGLSVLAWAFSLHARETETGADLAAGKAVGFAATARALDKIHAPLRKPEHGFLAYLAHATASHPAREVRLAALARAAPPEEQREIHVDPARVRRHRLAQALAIAVWAALIVGACWLARDGRVAWQPSVLLLTPFVFKLGVWLAIWRRELVVARWFSMSPFSPAALAVVLVAAPAAVVAFLGLYHWEDLVVALAGLGVLIVTIVAGVAVAIRSARLARGIERPLRQLQFGGAIEAYRRLGKRPAGLPANRMNHAFALGASGDRKAAIGELESLVRDKPRLQTASIWLARLLRYEDPERSLATIAGLAKPLQKHWLVHCLRAQALRLAGRLDEALASAREAVRAGPREGVAHAAAAFVAAELGLLEEALERIADAERLEPGATTVVLARAAVSIASGDAGLARDDLGRARAAVKNDPLSFLEEELALQERRAHQSSGRVR